LQPAILASFQSLSFAVGVAHLPQTDMHRSGTLIG
jgi:hypothetical protein